MIPTERDLRFAWEEMPQQVLDEQQQKMRDSAALALIGWASRPVKHPTTPTTSPSSASIPLATSSKCPTSSSMAPSPNSSRTSAAQNAHASQHRHPRCRCRPRNSRASSAKQSRTELRSHHSPPRRPGRWPRSVNGRTSRSSKASPCPAKRTNSTSPTTTR